MLPVVQGSSSEDEQQSAILQTEGKILVSAVLTAALPEQRKRRCVKAFYIIVCFSSVGGGLQPEVDVFVVCIHFG